MQLTNWFKIVNKSYSQIPLTTRFIDSFTTTRNLLYMDTASDNFGFLRSAYWNQTFTFFWSQYVHGNRLPGKPEQVW